MEDEEYKKLPVEEKCVHKLWKARVNGYEEVTNLFRQIDDEKSPEFSKYLGLVKKFVIDTNAISQEKGLEATLAYVENYAHAGKTVNEVMSGIVTKCIAAPKTKTRDLALQITLMYIEIEKYEAVQEELMKGMEQKNPKIVAACIIACTTALREFGSKVINVKSLVKKIGPLLADRDKVVRDETKQMVVEMYRWMGTALRPQLSNLQPVQLTELETEFSKIEGQKAAPTRYIKSQQQKQAKLAAETVEVDGDEDEGEEDDTPQEIDAYDLADPVDILSKMPKDFYEKLEAKKWQERKEALEAVETLLKTPKLENGDYGDLVRALKKVVQKDNNVVVVAIAGRCLASLASGLKKRFTPYANVCVAPLLEKFKEKKQNVVTAIRDAIDAVYLTTTIEVILEDVLEALANKNPSVKIETSLFLARAFTKTIPTALNKKLLKALTASLTKNINESDPTVRESSAEALGTLMKLVGEKAIGPFLVELEKDNLKMSKIRECCEKAVITVKAPAAKKERPTTAPIKTASKTGGSNAPKPVKRPAGSASEKKIPSSGSATIVKSKAVKGGSKGGKALSKPIEKELADEEVDAIVSDILNANTLAELSSANWKLRLAAVEQIQTELQTRDSKSVPTQALIKLISRKPGLKDTNFQVLKAKIGLVKYLAENCTFSTTAADCCVNEITEKFGDSKNGSTVCETMTAIAEATSLGHVLSTAMDFAFNQKSPKVIQEALIWFSGAIKEFGFSHLNAKAMIENLKKALAMSNPGVRQAAISLLGTLYLYMGAQLNVFFENEKPILRDQINAEFDKYEGAKPPTPTRGVTKSASSNSLDDDDIEDDEMLPPKKASQKELNQRGSKPAANAKKPAKGAAPAKAAPAGGSRKKDEDIDTSPLLAVNNLKHQRTIDEAKLKVLKWNFTQPREEFVELLKDQMTAASVNRTLMFNMFHSDFRFHIKAIESLMEDVTDNDQALIANLDLILKWLTLRFFDTNPSVLLKGLEYLNLVFNMLLENKYRMLENEASSFIPYLVVKIGDPKDTVRKGVRSLFKQICHVYSVSRLFTYIMEGLKSKNARQRAECLEVMDSIIEDYGITVCVPSAGACLKEVAKQISDRDNSVRNAALNCVVQAYNIVGEKIYKMVGNISDKDMSLLEERIKRSSRKTISKPKEEMVHNITPVSPQKEQQPQQQQIKMEINVPPPPEEEDDMEDEVVTFTTLPPQVPEAPKVQGPFKLDPQYLQELDIAKPIQSKVKLLEFDLDFLKDEIKVPSLSDARAKIMPLAPPKPVVPNESITRTSMKLPSPKKQEPLLEKTINQIGSTSSAHALQAISHMQEILQSPKSLALVDYENEIMTAITTQLKNIHSLDPRTDAVTVKMYRSLLTLIDCFYSSNQGLGKQVSVPVLKDIINELVSLLVEGKLETCPNGEAYIRVVNLHCVKIIERSDHTNIICALIKLIEEGINEDCSTRKTDLSMKCMWRVIKLMPSWEDDIDYDSILLEAHNFFKKYPSSWWKTKQVDTPLRTIKTVIHSSVKIKGGTLMLHLGKIPNTAESEMEVYILRLLKSVKLEEVKQVPLKTDTQRRSLTRANHNMLTDIFQKIGNKDETKEGLTLLYDFMQQHPEADIEPFLRKASKFFQDYIKQGLQAIEEARKSTKHDVKEKVASELKPAETIEATMTNNNTNARMNNDYWMERLNMWNKKFDEIK